MTLACSACVAVDENEVNLVELLKQPYKLIGYLQNDPCLSLKILQNVHCYPDIPAIGFSKRGKEALPRTTTLQTDHVLQCPQRVK